MHVPTGIYGTFAAGKKTIQNAVGSTDRDGRFWYAQLGVEKKFLPFGATTIYGEYGRHDDMVAHFEEDTARSEATRWGFGLVQKIEKAAMALYAQATFWSFEQSVFAGETTSSLDLEDLTTVMIGSRIRF